MFAVALPLLAVAITAVSELAEVETAKSELQNAVDEAAMKGAIQLETDQSTATAERTQTLADNLARPVKSRWLVLTQAQAVPTTGTMTVTQSASRGSLFGNLVPPGGFHITVSASAVANSTMPLCVLTTKTGGGQDLHLTASSTVSALSCLMQSDSNLQADPAASVLAAAVHTVGTSSGLVSPSALTDAPNLPDPFATLAITVPTLCTDVGLTVAANISATLAAGKHCGQVQVQQGGTLTLAAGDHFFYNANINMTSGTVTGTDVDLIFSGSGQIQASGTSTLSLNGRQSGPYAGFVIITDRSYNGTLNLNVANIPQLLGTVYLPAATLAVNSTGTGSAAGNSPWTVIVANGLQVQGTTHLVINSNYLASNVPVPAGVGPGGGGVQLTR